MDSITLHAAQLVYTNVEAEDSPTRRRGFQVWLYSPSLSESMRREIAKRLGDFHAPTPVRPTDPKPETVTRHVYFDAVEDGRRSWILAQTVALAERDKFGRGGRFYAHALVLTEAEFNQIYFNPFAILDSAFRFQSTIAEGKQSAEWRHGVLPEVELEIGALTLAAPAAPPLLAELITFLQRDEYAPIALPEPPEPVLGFLRDLFRWLPPQLRARASFDTLSTGQSLNAVPFRFAGAFAVDTLRRWQYRKAIRFERVAGKFTPPLEADGSALSRLVANWATSGTPPSDAEMRAAYALLTAIVAEDCSRCSGDGLNESRLREILALDGVGDFLPRLQRQRIETDLGNDALRSRIAPALQGYFQTPDLTTLFRRLSAPIPADAIAKWWFDVLTSDPLPQLAVDEAQQLSLWLANRAGDVFDRCRWMAQRWEGRFETIGAALTNEPDDERRQWLRKWCLRSSQAVFGGAENSAFQVRDQLDVEQPSERTLLEAQFYLSVSESPTPPASEIAPVSDEPQVVGNNGAEVRSAFDRDAIRFLVAFHAANTDRLIDLLGSPAGNALYDFILHRFEQAEARVDFRCYQNENDYYVGVETTLLGPAADALTALANACFQTMPMKTMRFWLGRATLDLPSPFEGWRVQPPQMTRERAELPQLVAKERWETLADRLRVLTDSGYQDFAETVIQPCRCELLASRPGPRAHWFGVRVGWLDPNAAATRNGMLGSVLRAILPVVETKTWDNLETLTPDGPMDRYRARWLLECLLRPEVIGKLVINRN